MQIAIAAVLLALVLGASATTPLVFNVSQSGSIMPGSSVTYTLQNTLESDGTPTAFYVLLDGNENCIIQSTTENSNPAYESWATNATFPSNSAVFFFTPPPTSAATLSWTITLQGIQKSCGYSIQARNMPAIPLVFGQTFTFEHTEPFGYVRFSTSAKDVGKPFPAVMFSIGVSTGGNPDFPGCEVDTMTDTSAVGSNGEDWFIADGNINNDGQWGIYSNTNGFIESVTGFFPSASVPVSFYVRANWNSSVPCPKWNVTLNPIPATPLKVGQSLALSYTSGGPFDPAIIFGPSGAQTYSLVLKYVSGTDDCPIGYAGNDPSTFNGQGPFQVVGGVHINATNPTVTVPVSGANAANYIWAAYLDNSLTNCQITASFQ